VEYTYVLQLDVFVYTTTTTSCALLHTQAFVSPNASLLYCVHLALCLQPCAFKSASNPAIRPPDITVRGADFLLYPMTQKVLFHPSAISYNIIVMLTAINGTIPRISIIYHHLTSSLPSIFSSSVPQILLIPSFNY
jgi:hypothetical protein